MSQTILQQLAEKRVGRTLKGKWTLDEVIGLGGMAAVYGATHRNGARVAIKVLHATLCASAELNRRFVREGYLGNKVDHPAVVRVLDDDVDETDDAAFLVMDRVEGRSLCDHLDGGLLDELDALDVAEQVLDILVAAHDKGVIHRDLKPDNLLVDDHGTIRLLDFGIARLLEDDGPVQTKTGITFGTPGYMAPEQALGQKDRISPQTDLYAVGATLFMLLTGEFVQIAGSPQELLVRIATRPARQLATALPSVSSELANIVDRATRRAPADRWPSAAAMLDEVRRVQALRGVARVVEVPRRRLSPRRQALEIAPPTRVNVVNPREEATTLGIARAVERGRPSVRPPSAMHTTRPSLARHHTKKRGRAWIVAAVAVGFLGVLLMRLPRHTTQPVGAAESTQVMDEGSLADTVTTEATTNVATTKGDTPHAETKKPVTTAPKPAVTMAKNPAATFAAAMQTQASGKTTLVAVDHTAKMAK